MMQRLIHNATKPIALLLLAALLVIGACSPTRRLKPNEKLLTKVVIEKDNKELSESDIKSYMRQVPNRKLLGFWRFYLQIYNLVDPDKALADHKKRLEKKEARQNKKIARRNKRCDKKKQRTGKDCAPADFSNEISAKPFREWIQGIGEAPVVFDTAKAITSVQEVRQYLFNQGYFFATVRDSIAEERTGRITQYYKIKAGHAYKIDSVYYKGTDTDILNIINTSKEERLIVGGNTFNTDKIAQERDRITKLLKNNGYYFFNTEYFKIDADTARKNHTCILTFTIKNPMVPSGKTGPDSLMEGKHIAYRMRNVYYNIAGDVKSPDFKGYMRDTTFRGHKNFYLDGKHRIPYGFKPYEHVIFTYEKSKPLFRPKTLLYHNFIKPGELYSEKNLDVTVSRLGDLRVFKFINAQYKADTSKAGKGLLDVYVNLTPSMRRSYAIESQGTNTGGNLGIGGTFTFINKNLFRGEEYLEFKIRGALEFQRLVNTEVVEQDQIDKIFNTQEYGASLALNIPRGIFPIAYFVTDPAKNPKSAITTSYNFQARPQYTRRIYGLSFGWNWKQNKRMMVTYNPIELNYLNAKLFGTYAENLPTIVLRSFDPQFIDAGRVSIIWSNQMPNKRKNYVFWRLGAESAGALLNLFAKKDPVDSVRKIGDVTTSQYLRFDFEIYPNFYLNDKNAFAFRAYVGYGLAYGNTPNSLPFAKAFFSGGSNGMRAWTQRGLGPGRFNKSVGNNIDQVGDIKFEFNAEYRLKLLSFLEPALFVDVGNIWLRKYDGEREGGNFEFKRFYKDFAVDYGIGLRIDLSFFLLRLDFARRLIDPGREYFNQRVLSPLDWSRYIPEGETRSKLRNPVVFQLGIGYPF